MLKKLVNSVRVFVTLAFMILSTNVLAVPLSTSVAHADKPAVECPTGSFVQGNNCKVTICHRTDSVTNPYVQEDVDLDSVDGNATNDNGQGDHYLDHTGPAATSEAVAQGLKDNGQNWGDIIPAIDGVHSGLNWTTDGQAVYNNDCAYVETPPTDVCANIDGVQTEVPEGLVQDGEDCVTPPTDVCANIDGVQTEVPEGLVQDGEDCVTDVCPNLEGIQTEIPEGKVIDEESGDCVTPPTDLCSNIPGDQTELPEGIVQSGDNICKVTICHRTDSVKNPYVQETVAVDSVDGDSSNDNGQGDHYLDHTGPVATSEAVAQALKDAHENWGDIIPPIPGIHSGLNWTAEGQAVFNNDCNTPQTCPQTDEDTPLLIGNLQIVNEDDNEDCTPPPTDVCVNIDGVQTEVPEGLVQDGEDCVTPPPTDVCPNIDGVQATIPSDKILDNSGNCVTPETGEVLGISTTKKQAELVNTGENPLASVLAGATLLVLAVGSSLLSRRQTNN